MNKQYPNDVAGTSGVILLVDDEPANLNVLEDMLAQDGHEIRAFPRGEMAVEAAAEFPPDLVLLDILMPGMDGYEVCREFKRHRSLAQIPILFLSALDGAQDKVKAFEAGAVDYVSKPLNEQEVKARVNTHLNLRTYSLSLEQLVAQQVQEISDAQMSVIFAMAKLAEFQDQETGQHLERVQGMSRLLAIQLRNNPKYRRIINEQFIDTLYLASALHDIGKVAVPDNILLKPDKLSPQEFEVIKTHTTKGAETLHEVLARHPDNDFVKMGIQIAGSHHERWDGTGYPKGLQGEKIPMSAKV